MSRDTEVRLREISLALAAARSGKGPPNLLAVYANPNISTVKLQPEFLPCLALFYDLVLVRVEGAADLLSLLDSYPEFQAFFLEGIFAPLFGGGWNASIARDAIAEEDEELCHAVNSTHLVEVGCGVVPDLVDEQSCDADIRAAAWQLAEPQHGLKGEPPERQFWDAADRLLYHLNYDVVTSATWNADLITDGAVGHLIRRLLLSGRTLAIHTNEERAAEIFGGLRLTLPAHLSATQVLEFRQCNAHRQFRKWYQSYRRKSQPDKSDSVPHGLDLAKHINRTILSTVSSIGRKQSLEWSVEFLSSFLPPAFGALATLKGLPNITTVGKRVSRNRWRFYFQEWIQSAH